MDANKTKAQGTFSFTFAAEWDYVSKRNIDDYTQNSYSISIQQRLDMEKALRILLQDGKWEPYPAVTDISEQGLFPYKENNSDKTKNPLYNEYLYFNSHMRRMVYNQTSYEATKATPCDQAATADQGVNTSVETQIVSVQTTATCVEKQNSSQVALDNYAMETALNGDAVVVLKRNCGNEYYYLYRHYIRSFCLHLKSTKKNAHRIETRFDRYFRSGYLLQRKFAKRVSFRRYRFHTAISNTILYKLPITSIELRLYSIGVMLITIRCQKEEFNKKISQENYLEHYKFCWLGDKGERVTPWQPVSSAEDLSWIENCGRRLFASRTVSSPCSDSGFFNDFPLFSCIASKEPNLFANAQESDCIRICDFRNLLRGQENRTSFTKPEQFDFVKELISGQCEIKSNMNNAPAGQDYLVLDSYNDDRMYLHGTIESEDIANSTRLGWQNRKNNEKQAANDLSPWYGIMYSDSHWDATCQDPQMLISAVENATEPRWCNYGTFHGMTYHSMIMLLPKVLPYNSYLVSNNDWIYLQMFLISVLQRCAIQRFYREASGLLQYHSSKDDQYRAAVQDKYTLFLNQFWFNEVTEQEQGKSMFKKLQAAMNIPEDVQILDTALEELYQQSESRTSGLINQLLVPMSVVGGFWAFTEMGLRLRDALSGWIPNINPVTECLGNAIAVFLFVCILLGIGVYFHNQRKYICQRFVAPCIRQRKIECIRKKHRK